MRLKRKTNVNDVALASVTSNPKTVSEAVASVSQLSYVSQLAERLRKAQRLGKFSKFFCEDGKI